MTLGKTQALFVVMLLYAGAVSVYITMSTSQAMAISPTNDQVGLFMGGFAFLNILGSAIAFMILVAILDLIAHREQQLLLALSVGLAATATWEAASQVAFIRSYAYYKDTLTKPGEQPPAPAH